MYCLRCNLKQDMIVSTTITKPPEVLNICLNRYLLPELLEIPVTPSTTLEFGDCQYTLKSIISHFGPNLNAGHYKSYLYNDTILHIKMFCPMGQEKMAQIEKNGDTNHCIPIYLKMELEKS